MACLLYPIELYADFSGYTDIALGGARMLGFKLQPKLQPAVHCTDHCRLLAPMAHVAFILGTRLSVPPVVLEPAWMGTMGAFLVWR